MLFLNFTNFYDNKINTKSLLELSVGQKKKKTNKQQNRCFRSVLVLYVVLLLTDLSIVGILYQTLFFS